MKKILSFALVLVMMLALAVPAMAAEGLTFTIGVKNSQEGGKTPVSIYEDDVLLGTVNISNGNFSGNPATIDNGTTLELNGVTYIFKDGKVDLKDDDPPHVHNYVKTLVGAEVSVTIIKDNGNTNTYIFDITEEYEWVCECGDRLDNTFESLDLDPVILHNNYEGFVTLGDYTIFINSKGNTQVREIYIVE